MKRLKAQALIAVLLLLALVGIFVGSLGSIWQAESKIRLSEREGMQAFYLAQAAIERAKVWVSNNHTAQGWFPSDTNWYTLGTGQLYRFRIEDLGGSQRRLRGYGEVFDGNNNVIAAKAIEVRIDDIDGQRGRHGNRDDDGRTVPGTWRQF